MRISLRWRSTVSEEAEPPIREFADRGVLWLLEPPRNLRDLLALVAHEIADRLDFDRAERINRSFIPEDLHKQEADLLYRVPYRKGKGKGEVWIYILLEHQSRPDRLMGFVCSPTWWLCGKRRSESTNGRRSRSRAGSCIRLCRWCSTPGRESGALPSASRR